MRRIAAVLLMGAATLAAGATRAAAQDYDADIGWGGGGVFFTNLADGPQALKLQAGWLANAHVEKWWGRRVAGRIGGAFTQRPLQLGSASAVGDIRTWMADASLLLRLAPASDERTVSPFIGAGVGVVSYQVGTGPRVVIGEAGAIYSGHDENQFAVLGSVGFDILPDLRWGMNDSQQIGFRIEATDRVALQSPFQDLNGSAFGPVHQIGVSLSIFSAIDWH